MTHSLPSELLTSEVSFTSSQDYLNLSDRLLTTTPTEHVNCIDNPFE
ncbi:hypothetical protein FOPG_19689 [Fusarium oxysporum f. sp. conglutinans race 2 54008]|uniref:Uncharacterized protein n=1 Tax=Fusarium oxysporum f. sp. conglutinans race 2 54008 TaxID=1089457 RepID=X0GW42_FUSOX|nr:hypothetical protein FOPG_19689 [Fusarium oxysporum f. sp. conglutinans race 2 54008]